MTTTGGEDTGPGGGGALTGGSYRVLVTDAGAGYSALGDVSLTRWDDDPTRDGDGFFLYVRDLESGRRWGAGLQPVPTRPDRYEVRRAPEAVEIERADGDLTLVTAVCLAPEGDAEIRRYTLTNHGARPRRLELTTYAEVALNTPAADAAHPAFSKLFVQTAYDSERQALFAWRRARSPDDDVLWLTHLLIPAAAVAAGIEWETDRARFIGRGRSLAGPCALDDGMRLSGTTGNVLDPIVSLRRTIILQPGETTHMTAVLGAGPDRAAVEAIATRLTAPAATDAPCAAAAAAISTVQASEPALARSCSHGVSAFVPIRSGERATPDIGVDSPSADVEPLRCFNGYGGFTGDGREYVIRMPAASQPPRRPPAPWVNIVANERFGFLVSESGAGHTWSVNSRENRLTPWYNDPVSDPHGEALYVRDDDAGVYWSPTAGPAPGYGEYETRHGWGYTRFRHATAELTEDVWQFVPRRDPVKIVHLRITNRGDRARRLSAFAYSEWVLGRLRRVMRRDIATEIDAASGAVLATSPERGEFSGRIAFAAVGATGNAGATYATCDREAFLGRLGSAERPYAVANAITLDGRTGVGLDPCAALQVSVVLAPGASADIVFLLGEAEHVDAVRAIVARYRQLPEVAAALDEVRAFWEDLLGGVRVDTPSPAIDLMVNGWVGYQNLSCRMWGRSAFYQSGGAFGFRDQLQDAAALIYLDPAVTRRQIILHAEHQFVDGDVLHWWHPPTSKGIRTRFSDDLLWLPYVTAFYVRTTGDASLLDAPARFITARRLDADEDEVFLFPDEAGERADVYEHCCRALDRSLTRGAHGLPLIGSGDWNDGMNRVGREGRGESVWLGFFLHRILGDFMPLVEGRGDAERAARYQAYRSALGVALEDAGWDGAWYRRAYYDDGAPLGSAGSDECRIDAIAQAWAVLSGVAAPERAALALDALERHLVSEPEGLIRLLTPAFDRTPDDPGYIKGYLPGVRENGGQYTHGALWGVRALAEAGRAERAAPLLAMLSAASRAGSPAAAEIYKVEPYVMAADVYGVAPHVGRGGWTWYTGSAGWFFRVAVESVLGMEMRGGHTLSLRPCIPLDWPGYSMRIRLDDRRTWYEIVVARAAADDRAATAAWLDGELLGVEQGRVLVPLARDACVHHVRVVLGRDAGTGAVAGAAAAASTAHGNGDGVTSEAPGPARGA